MKQEQGFQ